MFCCERRKTCGSNGFEQQVYFQEAEADHFKYLRQVTSKLCRVCKKKLCQEMNICKNSVFIFSSSRLRLIHRKWHKRNRTSLKITKYQFRHSYSWLTQEVCFFDFILYTFSFFFIFFNFLNGKELSLTKICSFLNLITNIWLILTVIK